MTQTLLRQGSVSTRAGRLKLPRRSVFRRQTMRRFVKVVLALSSVLLLPSVVFAQAGLAGNVKDSSGAVLPGVTVEASSPALIEKTRSVVTDGSGNYKIENVRPGTYSVTFTLPGFNTVKREGIELAGSFVATVNADM